MYLHEGQTAGTFLGLQFISQKSVHYHVWRKYDGESSHFNLYKAGVTIYVGENSNTKIQQKEESDLLILSDGVKCSRRKIKIEKYMYNSATT